MRAAPIDILITVGMPRGCDRDLRVATRDPRGVSPLLSLETRTTVCFQNTMFTQYVFYEWYIDSSNLPTGQGCRVMNFFWKAAFRHRVAHLALIVLKWSALKNKNWRAAVVLRCVLAMPKTLDSRILHTSSKLFSTVVGERSVL